MCQIDYQYLRPKKAAALKAQHAAPYHCVETPSVWQGANATILPVQKTDQFGWTGCGGVVDADGQSVGISAVESCVRPRSVFSSPEYRDEKVVYCGYLIHHWGHFLVEGVARLWYFLERDPSVDKYVFALDEGEVREVTGNYKEFFVLLNIWDKLEFINRPTTYREVLVPDLAFRRQDWYSPKYLDVFHEVSRNVPKAQEPTPKKIYMSRSLLPKHGKLDFGFESLDDFYQKNGYVILFPERLSLSQLIQYIRGADTVACVSGTLPQNMLFGKQGQKLVILERCAFINDWQPPVDRIKELDTTYIDANISIYTVSMAGPFLMGYNRQVEKYAQDHGFLPPCPYFCSQKYLRSCFVGYMKSYQRLYHSRWFMEEYLLPGIDYHVEAYQDSLAYFGDYLRGERPFLVRHYFQWHYFKQMVKILLKKVNLR